MKGWMNSYGKLLDLTSNLSFATYYLCGFGQVTQLPWPLGLSKGEYCFSIRMR